MSQTAYYFRTRTSALALVFFLCCFCFCNSPFSISAAFGRQLTVSSDELAPTGLTRVEEILVGLPGLRATTIDGYSMNLAIDGRSGLSESGPLFYIDGRPQYFFEFGRNQAAALPVAVSSIESIVVSGRPDHATILSSRGGRIDIITLRPKGLVADVSFFARNEINDPGPYRFTQQTSQNIDRSGPHVQASASYGNDSWFLRLSTSADEHHVTSEKIRDRIRALYASEDGAKIKQEQANLLLERSTGTGRHSLHMGHSRLRDFVFLFPERLEIPLKQEWTYISAHGNERLGEVMDLEYTLDQRWWKSSPRPTTVPFGPPISKDMLNARVAISLRSGSVDLGLDTGITSHSIDGRSPTGQGFRRSQAGLQLSAGLTEKQTSHKVSLLVLKPLGRGQSQESPRVSVMWSAEWKTATDAEVAFTAAYGRTSQPDSFSPEESIARAESRPIFAVPEMNAVALPSSTELETRLSVSVPITPSAQVHVTSFYEQWKNRSGYAPGRATDSAIPDLGPGDYNPIVISGHLVGSGLDITLRSPTGYFIAARYSWIGSVFKPSASFDAFLSGVTGHRFSVSGLYPLNPRFRIFSRIDWLPRHRWPDFDKDSESAHITRLSADISFQKDLFDDYAELSVGLRHLGQSVQLHPDGAVEALALQITLRLRFRNCKRNCGN